MSDTNDPFSQQHEVDEPLIGDAPPKADVLLSNGVYDKLKPLAHIWLPALALFYLTIAPLWGLPKAEEVSGTIIAIDLLLGAVLGASSRQYRKSDARFDGSIQVEPGEDEDTTNLNVSLDPEAVANKKEITVKIDRV